MGYRTLTKGTIRDWRKVFDKSNEICASLLTTCTEYPLFMLELSNVRLVTTIWIKRFEMSDRQQAQRGRSCVSSWQQTEIDLNEC